MKLVVVGAGGGLGSAFLSIVSGHDVAAFTHAQLDIGDDEAVMSAIVPLEADAILNFAAYTKVDACELDEEGAFRTNAIGVRNLALAARANAAVLLHVSTDYVFNGEKGAPYDERDIPDPRSVYARSKLSGEEFARQLIPSHFVLRTGFVFGGGTDFLTGAVAKLAMGEEAGGLQDRVGTPTYVRHLAERVLPLIASGEFGTYHVAGPEPTTWFDVLTRLKAIGGLPGAVVAQQADELGLLAPRPRNSALVSVYSDAVGVPPMPPLDEGLKELLDAG